MQYIGKNLPIHDAESKVQGTVRYVADMQIPGMLHMALLFSPIPHGRVKHIDASKALAMEGVEAVFHCFNSPLKTFCRYRSQYGQNTLDQERLFSDQVRFVGDRIAAVLASDEQTAREAVRKIKVDFEPLPHALNIEEAEAGINADIFPEGAIFGEFEEEYGQANLTDEDLIFETDSYLSRLIHAAMETHACLVDYCQVDDSLTIYSPVQSVHGLRTVVADLLDLPYNKVRVVKTTMGGSFGTKQEWSVEPMAAYAARELKRAVRLVYNREETIRSTICRGPMRGKVKSHFTADGKLKALMLDVALDAGAYVTNGIDYLRAMSSKLFRTYRYDMARFHGKTVCTNSPVSGSFRGWSSPELCTMVEHHMNLVARELKVDPLELRLRNVVTEGEIDKKLNLSLGNVQLKACLERGREAFNWERRQADDQAFNASQTRYRRGTAVACGGHVSSYYPRYPDFGSTRLSMSEDGSVTGHVSVHDLGCGTVQAIRMIIAETLNMPIERILIPEADSLFTPFDYGCYSSRTTFVVGRAAREAARKLGELLIEEASKFSGWTPDQLELRGECIILQNDGQVIMTYPEAARHAIFKSCRQPEAHFDYRNTSNPGVTGAHFAQVEVDCLTGRTQVLDYLAVHDIGRVINRGLCVGQVQGAVLMGAGAALSESLQVGPDGSVPSNFHDYHLVNVVEGPSVEVIFVEAGDAEGPFGAKSIGEVCFVPAAAAVCGAVNKALETNLGILPLDLDIIMAALIEEEE